MKIKFMSDVIHGVAVARERIEGSWIVQRHPLWGPPIPDLQVQSLGNCLMPTGRDLVSPRGGQTKRRLVCLWS